MDNRDKSTVMEYLAFSYERMNQDQNAYETWQKVADLNTPPYAIAARERIKEYTIKRGAN
jgi:cytochrome c-type biogenesis protein CcmH/NrfG